MIVLLQLRSNSWIDVVLKLVKAKFNLYLNQDIPFNTNAYRVTTISKFREDIILLQLKPSMNTINEAKEAMMHVDIRTESKVGHMMELRWVSNIVLSGKHPDSLISSPGLTKKVTIKRKENNKNSLIKLYWVHDKYKKYKYFKDVTCKYEP